MKLLLFGTLEEAEGAQRAMDVAADLPREHAEGPGPDDYSIAQPGNAAARIRARGVRSLHVAELLTNAAGTAFALRADAHPAAREMDLKTWYGPPQREGSR